MRSLDRRSVLLAGLGLAGSGALAACTGNSGSSMTGTSMPDMSASPSPMLVDPSGPQVAAADAKRTRTGRSVNVSLMAVSGMVDLGGPTVSTWAFDGRLPGREIRISAGDTLAVTLANHLAQPTAIHWHGVALRNDMDGVPPVTQRAVAPGAAFTYRFTTDAPGTYWFHPHVGVQLDRGLYGPLIVQDPHEPLKYDDEWVVVLDDWLDGVTGTPDQVFAALNQGMAGMGMGSGGSSASPSASSGGMSGMDMGSSASTSPSTGGMDSGMDMGSASASPSMGGMSGSGSQFMLTGASSALLGGDAGDVKYPYYLVNGKVAASPEVYRGKPGDRLRIRMINAGGDTAFRVALGGHQLTITHTDGYPVKHQQVDAILIAPGERYDVLVTLGDGIFPLTALAEGKDSAGRALVRTGSGRTPSASVRPRELNGMIMTAGQLTAADEVKLSAKNPDRTHRIELTGNMSAYSWAINGRRFDMNKATASPFLAAQGQRVRLEFVNSTKMWHPMHLHGHTYQQGANGPRKDTSIVLPGQSVTCDFDADNPGQWLLHCHNVYHGEAGMMGLLAYSA